MLFKAKLNSFGGLDKLKARICVRGDMQMKDLIKNLSPTASVCLLKYVLADTIQNGAVIHQLNFIQALIRSPTKKRIFIVLDKEYEMFCPQLAEHFGRPLRLKKCIHDADLVVRVGLVRLTTSCKKIWVHINLGLKDVT